MQDLRVSIIQTDIYWENVTANLAMLEEKIALLKPTDLIILPEMFNTGFTANTKLAEPMNGHTYKWLKMMAKKTTATLIGSVLISEKNLFVNRLFFAKPDGDISFYDKRYLFRMSQEATFLTKGNFPAFFTIKNWRICPSICYEIRFPESCRNAILPNSQTLETSFKYDLLINIANWPNTRKKAWQTLLCARAIENQSYVIGVNRIGKDYNNLHYVGESAVITPEGDILNKISVLDESIQCTLSAAKLIESRKNFPSYLDWGNA